MVKDETINVLFVDDELDNLTGFKAYFRRYYTVFIANSAKEAEIVLLENSIHILITDQRMPLKSGTELLAEAYEKYPDQIRILLTAYADINCMNDAINKGHVHGFLQKPWNQSKLKKMIEEGYVIFDLKRKQKIFNKELLLANQELELALKQKKDME